MPLFDPRVFGAVPAGLRRERMQSSPRYKDGRFHNTEPLARPMSDRPLREQLAMGGDFLFGGSRRTPGGVIPVESPLETWGRRPGSGLRATWLGHSTVLLEIDGLRVLTDPVWGERVSPVPFAGPRRFHRVPVTVDQIPDVDVVIVSHDHYDHLDHATITALARRPITFVTSLGVGAHLEAWGVPSARIVELDWWESASLFGGRLGVTAAPSRHFSGRGNGSNRTAWSSFVVRSDHHSVFFSGDTGLTRELEDVGARLGPFDLVMLEIGAFHPSWGSIHLGPENALEAFRMLGGRMLLPVHWGTFDLALHAWDEPAEILTQGAERRGLPVVIPRVGRPVEPSLVEASSSVDPWWREVARAREGRPSPTLSPVRT